MLDGRGEEWGEGGGGREGARLRERGLEPLEFLGFPGSGWFPLGLRCVPAPLTEGGDTHGTVTEQEEGLGEGVGGVVDSDAANEDLRNWTSTRTSLMSQTLT